MAGYFKAELAIEHGQLVDDVPMAHKVKPYLGG
jgi:hypothetical protein